MYLQMFLKIYVLHFSKHQQNTLWEQRNANTERTDETHRKYWCVTIL